MNSIQKIALFVDAENISYEKMKTIFDTLSSRGEILIKRIYGDWSNENLKNWKYTIEKYPIKAIQCFHFTSNKNTSDMAMIIDAMECLYEREVDIFVIASGDSDYLSLVQMIKEKGKQILGFGKSNANKSYVNAFDEFIYLDEALQVEKQAIRSLKDLKEDEKQLLEDLNQIIEELIEKNGKAEYAQIGTEIRRKYADFTPQNYGYKNFRTLINKSFLSIDEYKELYLEGIGENNITLFIKYKQ